MVWVDRRSSEMFSGRLSFFEAAVSGEFSPSVCAQRIQRKRIQLAQVPWFWARMFVRPWGTFQGLSEIFCAAGSPGVIRRIVLG